MLTLEDIKTYHIPGLPKLEEHQIKFFVDTMNGRQLKYAYEEYYLPVMKKKNKSTDIGDLASQIAHSKWYRRYKAAFEDVLKKKAENEITWNLGMSIKERRKLYSLNLIEVDRLAEAYDMEVGYYTTKKKEALLEGNEKKCQEYEEKILKAIRRKNMSIASNNACLQALEGLDKLCGLQTVNVNHSGEVNFFGDDLWNISGDQE